MIAAERGHTDIVALLLKVKGIDVNMDVSIMIPILTMSPLHSTSTNPYHYLYGIFFFFFPSVVSIL